MDAWLLAIGTELALGQTVDTNSAWLAAQLATLGVRAVRHITVPDDLLEIQAALTAAVRSADLILVTGGLGPTEDDLTRRALADVAQEELVLNPAGVDALRAYFAVRNRPMSESNLVQALLPRTAQPIPNTCGTAPGIRMSLSGRPCYVMPGVPFEMRAMFERDVAPELAARAGGGVVLFRRLNTFGLGESLLGERIRDLMQRGRNPEVGTTAGGGVIGVRINATAESAEAAGALLDEAEAEIRGRLGEIVYGRDDETLAGAVGALLAADRRTLATAESCTGGMIGALITDVAGSSRYYCGGAVTYSNAAKTAVLGVPPEVLAAHGAVSAPVAAAMAAGAARVFAAEYALSVTGVAGPGGGSVEKPVGLVYIGLHGPEAARVQEQRFGEAPREMIRLRAARTALNLLRLKLLGR